MDIITARSCPHLLAVIHGATGHGQADAAQLWQLAVREAPTRSLTPAAIAAAVRASMGGVLLALAHRAGDLTEASRVALAQQCFAIGRFGPVAVRSDAGRALAILRTFQLLPGAPVEWRTLAVDWLRTGGPIASTWATLLVAVVLSDPDATPADLRACLPVVGVTTAGLEAIVRHPAATVTDWRAVIDRLTRPAPALRETLMASADAWLDPDLCRFLLSSPADRIAQAVVALAPAVDDPTLSAVVHAIGEAEPAVAGATVIALLEAPGAPARRLTPDAVAGALVSPDPVHRLAALRALGMFPDALPRPS